MSREYMFRGKRIDNGEWVCGGYANIGDKHGIITGTLEKIDIFYVDPKTVGEWIGQHDKNGTPIYEGDVLATGNDDPKCDHWNKEDFGFTIVEWDSKYTCFQGSSWMWEMNSDTESVYDMQFVEVVGNIHDNHELLEARSAIGTNE